MSLTNCLQSSVSKIPTWITTHKRENAITTLALLILASMITSILSFLSPSEKVEGCGAISQIPFLIKAPWLAASSAAFVALAIYLIQNHRKASNERQLVLAEAENAKKIDPGTILPKPILSHIFSFLNLKELLAVDQMNKSWREAALPLWKFLLKNKIGMSALQLENSFCKKIMKDARKPVSMELSTLADLIWDSNEQKALSIIHQSIEKDDLSGLKEQLADLQKREKIEHINARYKGFTPLELAASLNKIEMAKELISFGAKDAIQDNVGISEYVRGHTALFQAAIASNVEMVEFLLEKGARADWILVTGDPLMYRNLKKSFVYRLLASYKDLKTNKGFIESLLLILNSIKGGEEKEEMLNPFEICTEALNLAYVMIKSKVTLLRVAEFSRDCIKRRDLEGIKFLYETKLFDLLTFTKNHLKNLLFELIDEPESKEVLDYFIKIGFPTEEVNELNETYLEYGKRLHEERVRKNIAKHFMSTKETDLVSLEECFKEKIDLNVPINDNGDTLLHEAVKPTHIKAAWDKKIISNLLDHGANVTRENKNRKTPLDMLKDALKSLEKLEDQSNEIKDQQVFIKKVLDRLNLYTK